jgi:hypothetical protein
MFAEIQEGVLMVRLELQSDLRKSYEACRHV